MGKAICTVNNANCFGICTISESCTESADGFSVTATNAHGNPRTGTGWVGKLHVWLCGPFLHYSVVFAIISLQYKVWGCFISFYPSTIVVIPAKLHQNYLKLAVPYCTSWRSIVSVSGNHWDLSFSLLPLFTLSVHLQLLYKQVMMSHWASPRFHSSKKLAKKWTQSL